MGYTQKIEKWNKDFSVSHDNLWLFKENGILFMPHLNKIIVIKTHEIKRLRIYIAKHTQVQIKKSLYSTVYIYMYILYVYIDRKIKTDW